MIFITGLLAFIFFVLYILSRAGLHCAFMDEWKPQFVRTYIYSSVCQLIMFSAVILFFFFLNPDKILYVVAAFIAGCLFILSQVLIWVAYYQVFVQSSRERKELQEKTNKH